MQGSPVLGWPPLLHGRRDWTLSAFACLYAATALPLLWRGEIPAGAVVPSLLLGAALIWLSAIDLRTFRLPDALVLPLIAAGLLMSAYSGAGVLWSAASALLGAALLYAVALGYKWLRGQEGLGLGDAKLLAAAGAWLGAESLGTVLLYACAAALVSVLVAACRGGDLDRNSKLAFGPFLAYGTWLVWLYGPLS
ncbi:MAG: A24 family peptidase [Hyphomicrobiaceae bacterium]|nr:A24 family peptidase [Hyphomicrobiaceae bacterium]